MFSLFASESNRSTVLLPLLPCFAMEADPSEDLLFVMLPFPNTESGERRGRPGPESAFAIEDPLRVWFGAFEGAPFSLLDLEMVVALKERLPDMFPRSRDEWRRSGEGESREKVSWRRVRAVEVEAETEGGTGGR